MTVEASLIMPQIIFLIAVLLWLSFFLYDRCILTQDAYILAFRGSVLCSKDKEQIVQHMEENMPKQLSVKYFGINLIQKELSADIIGTRVLFEGEMGITGWHSETEKTASRICPVKYIRLIRLSKKGEA